MGLLAFSQPTFPLPAGIVAISPPVDLTGSFPSAKIDLGLDWLMYGWSNVHFPKPSKAWPPTDWTPCGDVMYSRVPLHPLVNLSRNTHSNCRHLQFLLQANYPNVRLYSSLLEITNIFEMRQVYQMMSWIHSHMCSIFCCQSRKEWWNCATSSLQIHAACVLFI